MVTWLLAVRVLYALYFGPQCQPRHWSATIKEIYVDTKRATAASSARAALRACHVCMHSSLLLLLFLKLAPDKHVTYDRAIEWVG